jgi:hypothetical protein
MTKSPTNLQATETVARTGCPRWSAPRGPTSERRPPVKLCTDSASALDAAAALATRATRSARKGLRGPSRSFGTPAPGGLWTAPDGRKRLWKSAGKAPRRRAVSAVRPRAEPRRPAASRASRAGAVSAPKRSPGPRRSWPEGVPIPVPPAGTKSSWTPRAGPARQGRIGRPDLGRDSRQVCADCLVRRRRRRAGAADSGSGQAGRLRCPLPARPRRPSGRGPGSPERARWDATKARGGGSPLPPPVPGAVRVARRGQEPPGRVEAGATEAPTQDTTWH